MTRLLAFLLLISFGSIAQERVAPVDHNPFVKGRGKLQIQKKTTAISLPFFEDFTGYKPVPDPANWTDAHVYVNNTMAFDPISRGVATFDALNARGGPYDSSFNTNLVYADSLTSQPIDISALTPADSIYLSFFFQPQGTGFAPEAEDSLMLYLKDEDGDWNKVWGIEGGSLQVFRQIMIAVNDTAYFHPDFQFRFVNKASINLNDDVWNIDYIRMDANRNMNDTTVPDVTTTLQPSFLLNDYTSMPYRQFAANMSAELNTQHYFYMRNNYSTQQNVTYGYTARETETNTSLFAGVSNSVVAAGYSSQQFTFSTYPVTFSAPDPNSKVVFEQTYFATTTNAEPKENDTIVKRQVFDNYLAYDDGTAEKSYFLNQFVTLPGKIAVEYHLNQPDTLRGVAIYFGRQVPLATNKFFSVAVYKSITLGSSVEDRIYLQELLFPSYADSVNHYWVYKLDTPVVLPAGTFYLGTIQPASSGGDSLYIGLDANRIGGNHLYFNVLDQWESSLASGALMIRPILGQDIDGTNDVKDIKPVETEWSVFPNPSNGEVTVNWEGKDERSELQVFDAQGRMVLSQEVRKGQTLGARHLSSGIYFVRIFGGNITAAPRKLIIQ